MKAHRGLPLKEGKNTIFFQTLRSADEENATGVEILYALLTLPSLEVDKTALTGMERRGATSICDALRCEKTNKEKLTNLAKTDLL